MAIKKFKKFTRNLWAQIAAFFAVRWLKPGPDSPLDFTRLVDGCHDWLLIMPADANAFRTAIGQCEEVLAKMSGVRFHLLLPLELRGVVKATSGMRLFSLNRHDLFLGVFPRSSLIQRLKEIQPQVALDLSPKATPLSLVVSGLSGAKVRGALARSQGNSIFNLLIESRSGELKDRYRALFAYLG